MQAARDLKLIIGDLEPSLRDPTVSFRNFMLPLRDAGLFSAGVMLFIGNSVLATGHCMTFFRNTMLSA